MPEQSVGMTTGTGDGTVGGYLNTRMTAKDLASIGAGIFSNQPSVTGTGTSTLTIGVCSISVQGYFYQNNSALTINVSTVSSGDYFLVCRVNDTAGSVTVVRSAAGTTIGLRSVRLCLVNNYSVNTDIKVCSVRISGGVISIIQFGQDFGPGLSTTEVAVSTAVSKSDFATLTRTTTQTITSGSDGKIDFTSLITGSSGVFYTVDIYPGEILMMAGAYMISIEVDYPVGATGYRQISYASRNYINDLNSIRPTGYGFVFTQRVMTYSVVSYPSFLNAYVVSLPASTFDIAGARIVAVRL